MVYLKVVLNDKRLKEDNVYPIVIRVTYNRNNTSISTGLRVNADDWDKNTNQVKRSNQNFNLLNQKLSEFYLKVQKAILKFEDGNDFSFENLKESLEDKPKVKTETLTFKEYAEKLIQELHEVKRTGNAIVYQTAVNRLINFSNNKNLTFKQIDYTFLDGFKRQLIKEGAKPNTVGNYFRSIRAIYNKAIKAKLVERNLYPFRDISIRTEKTAKRAMTSDALTGLNKVALKPNSPEWNARNYLFLSFSLIGISFTDLAYLKHKDIYNGRVTYKRRKTHKTYNVKLSRFTREILSLYKTDGKYLLPILPSQIEEDTMDCKRIIQQWVKTTNKYLKRVGKQCGIANLTTYVARHSWATTAKRLGYSIEMIAEAMGHEYGNKITNIYLDSFDQSLIDEMNEKVISCLL